MMLLRSIALGATIALSGFVPTADAQIARTALADAPPPAEFPPPSFTGRQYVDSKGCVYVRAGQGNAAIWVPRVAGNKNVLCGFKPTLTASAASSAPVVADPAPARVAAAPAPAAAPDARTVATVPRRVSAGVRYVPPRVTHNLTPAPYRAAGGVPAQTAGQRVLTGQLPGGTTIAVPSAPPVRVAAGYKRAWNDGRLNPNAGKQTLTGALQQSLVWTQTVPRRLKTADGRDVTSRYNFLVYPYTDYDKQRAALGTGRYLVVQTTAGREIVPRATTRISTKSQPQVTRQAPASGGARYVQVGSFGNPANAQRTAQRLQAAGLPVRIQRSGGLQVVLAGPVAAGSVNGVLGTVRGAGFRDAFVR